MTSEKIGNKNNTALIIFTRFPGEGRVKTRLASGLGNSFAAEFYKLCAEHTFRECRKASGSGINSFLFYSDPSEKELVENWAGNGFTFMPQSGDDLGGRMNDAFKKVFELGAGKALIIGTDLPDISADLILRADEELNTADAVIGPAADGGYYLLGMKSFSPELFENISWSSPSVFEQTETVLKRGKLLYKILPKLNDIDTEYDLLLWLNNDAPNANKRLKSSVRNLLNKTL